MALVAVLVADVRGRTRPSNGPWGETLALAQFRGLGQGAFTMTCPCQQMPRKHSLAEGSPVAMCPCPLVLGTSRCHCLWRPCGHWVRALAAAGGTVTS